MMLARRHEHGGPRDGEQGRNGLAQHVEVNGLGEARDVVSADELLGASHQQNVMLRTRGRILVVDDEPTITELLGHAFAQDGHTVDTATDGADALVKIRRRGPYDLIVSGVVMPRLGGFQLYRELARYQPGLDQRVIFVTGAADTPPCRQFVRRHRVPCFPKPVHLDVLRQAVAALLAITRPAVFVSPS